MSTFLIVGDFLPENVDAPPIPKPWLRHCSSRSIIRTVAAPHGMPGGPCPPIECLPPQCLCWDLYLLLHTYQQMVATPMLRSCLPNVPPLAKSWSRHWYVIYGWTFTLHQEISHIHENFKKAVLFTNSFTVLSSANLPHQYICLVFNNIKPAREA